MTRFINWGTPELERQLVAIREELQRRGRDPEQVGRPSIINAVLPGGAIVRGRVARANLEGTPMS